MLSTKFDKYLLLASLLTRKVENFEDEQGIESCDGMEGESCTEFHLIIDPTSCYVIRKSFEFYTLVFP